MNAPGPWYERRGSGSRPETRTCQPHLCLMPNFARFFMHSAFDEFFVKTNRNYQHRYCVYVLTLPRNVHNPMCLCDNTTLQYRSAQIRLFGAHKPQGTTGCEPRKVRARGTNGGSGSRPETAPVNLASVWCPISHAFSCIQRSAQIRTTFRGPQGTTGCEPRKVRAHGKK
jgi:hypothetical protein